ncbi:hypothetical protein [Nocardia sp. NPDC049149]|uniref:hypothetical protein n=1 Tax=Nocardia sp. NPDC049149 TaxID=3364315 RepID=UPI0037246127
MSPSVLDPVDRIEFVRFANAVSTAIHDVEWLPLTVRYRIAARAWRILHPDSRYGES